MGEFREFPKGNIRRNFNFYWAALGSALIVILGVFTIIKHEIRNRGGALVFQGDHAIYLGIIFTCFGVYDLYYLFFMAEAYELALSDYHELTDFEDVIDGYSTKFEVENMAAVSGGHPIGVYYYRLEIRFKKKLHLGIDIKQRDRVEHFLWLVGITRFFDVHTSSRHFDSQYRVKCSNIDAFNTAFSPHVIAMLEEFDKSYPPIRRKNGILRITDTGFRYLEGPYGEDQRLFDPHRGKIEALFRELIKIMREIER